MAQAMEWAVFRIDMWRVSREEPSLGRHATYTEAKEIAAREDMRAFYEGLSYSYRPELVRVRKEG